MGKKPVLVIAGAGAGAGGAGLVLPGAAELWLGYVLSFAGALVLWTRRRSRELQPGARNVRLGGGGGRGSAYVAVNSVIINIAGCLGGLAAGVIAQGLRDWQWVAGGGVKTFSFYDVLFVLSGVLRLAAVAVFLPFLHEPTAGRIADCCGSWPAMSVGRSATR